MLALPFILALPPTGQLGVEVGLGGFRGCERGREGGAHRVRRGDRKRERAVTRIHNYQPCTRAQSALRSARDTCFWSSCVGREALSAFSQPSFPLYSLQTSASRSSLPPCSYCCLIIVSHLFSVPPGLSEKLICVLLSSRGLHDFERQLHANATPSHWVDSRIIVYC